MIQVMNIIEYYRDCCHVDRGFKSECSWTIKRKKKTLSPAGCVVTTCEFRSLEAAWVHSDCASLNMDSAGDVFTAPIPFF